MAVVISDFLTDGDLRRSFNLLHNAGLEICAVQLLGPSELDPEISGDLRFVDSEDRRESRHLCRGRPALALHEYRLAMKRSSPRSASSARENSCRSPAPNRSSAWSSTSCAVAAGSCNAPCFPPSHRSATRGSSRSWCR
ncbi:MAG: hypothetical protein WDN28_22450 [Chthoniobacter sp.]